MDDLVRETLERISENTPISAGLILAVFGILMTIGGALMLGYNMIWEVKSSSQMTTASVSKLEDRVSRLEQGQNDIQSIKTDIAVIKTNIENIQKNMPLTQGRK